MAHIEVCMGPADVSVLVQAVGNDKRETLSVEPSRPRQATLESQREKARRIADALGLSVVDKTCSHPAEEKWFDQGSMMGGCNACGAKWAE